VILCVITFKNFTKNHKEDTKDHKDGDFDLTPSLGLSTPDPDLLFSLMKKVSKNVFPFTTRTWHGLCEGVKITTAEK